MAGVDHIGLGSDFDGVDALPEGIDGVDALPKITRELLARGHSEDNTTLSGDGSPRRIDDP